MGRRKGDGGGVRRASPQTGVLYTQIINPQSSFINRSGFPLIELLVAVAVVALWPAGIRGGPTDSAEPALALRSRQALIEEALNGVRTERIACCPMATKTTGKRAVSSGAAGEEFQVNSGGTFTAWEIVRPPPSFRMSYGLNRNLFSLVFEGPGSSLKDRPDTDVFSLRGRDRIPSLLDTGQPNVGFISERPGPPEVEPSATEGSVCINRHNGTVNGLFLDWSVRKVGLKELWTLRWHLQYNVAGRWTRAGGVRPEDWPPWMRKFKDY